ncbi:MAG: hypothetical protein DIZ77_05175 [endosymbiont of Seepiophila jonesi]|uniref:Uncharacterized protein n=1 Tax=endosymbiont of Lamellibrachia luymesi TaxID=2200907 RepID=A0A370DPE2_9GAMM|nr:MAG: hypothetical protein DIZ79_16490 [endosymbiont of Lamellibrachia luymesi]RDH93680.1 MAG: hypothetical protein DIZ77_05175 [endosymbiont of Seepiophila jonesi]
MSVEKEGEETGGKTDNTFRRGLRRKIDTGVCSLLNRIFPQLRKQQFVELFDSRTKQERLRLARSVRLELSRRGDDLCVQLHTLRLDVQRLWLV